MKSIVYHGAADVRVEDVADPILSSEDEAIIQIRMCGICGSDLHPYHVNVGRSGYCMGHEAVGEVVETGSAVRNFKVGDRVFIAGSISCGQCAECLNGYSLLCANHPYPRVFGQGTPGIGGCQAEAISVPMADTNMFILPRGISDEVGIMLTDNLPTAWLCTRRGKVGPGSSVAVIGLGSVGLQAVMVAFALGADRVFGIDLVEARRAAAATLGAEAIEAGIAAEYITETTRGLGVDTVIDAVGGPLTTQLAVHIVRKGGTISVVGAPESYEMPFPIMQALAKNVEFVLSSCSVQAEIPAIFSAFEAGSLRTAAVDALVTHRLPLSQGSEAYALFDSRADGVRKLVLSPGN